jgi:hypothetical protein
MRGLGHCMSGSSQGWLDMSSSSVRPRIQSPSGLCSLDPQCRVKLDRRCSHLNRRGRMVARW